MQLFRRGGATLRTFLKIRRGASPIECRLNEVPGVLKDVFLAMFLGEDRVEHKLLRPVVAVHLDGGLVHEANGPLTVLVDFISEHD